MVAAQKRVRDAWIVTGAILAAFILVAVFFDRLFYIAPILGVAYLARNYIGLNKAKKLAKPADQFTNPQNFNNQGPQQF